MGSRAARSRTSSSRWSEVRPCACIMTHLCSPSPLFPSLSSPSSPPTRSSSLVQKRLSRSVFFLLVLPSVRNAKTVWTRSTSLSRLQKSEASSSPFAAPPHAAGLLLSHLYRTQSPLDSGCDGALAACSLCAAVAVLQGPGRVAWSSRSPHLSVCPSSSPPPRHTLAGQADPVSLRTESNLTRSTSSSCPRWPSPVRSFPRTASPRAASRKLTHPSRRLLLRVARGHRSVR